jgi:hypothetical protein
MKRIDLGQTIAILANVGVIVGIAFLVFELRQNTQAVQLASAQTYLTGGSELDLRIATDADLASLLVRSVNPELSAVEELQLERWNYAVLRQWETAQYLHSIGALDERLWLAYRHEIRKIFLRGDRLREYWSSNNESFTPAFRNEIEELLSGSERGQP